MDDDDLASSYESESDSSFLDSDMEDEAQGLMDVLHGDTPTIAQAAASVKSPEQVWAEYVEGLQKSTTNNLSIKITDNLVEWIANISNANESLARTEMACADLIRAIETHAAADRVVIHVILGRVFLFLLSPPQQERLFSILITHHASTITYWKLGSDDSVDVCGIATSALLKCMSSTADMWTNLTEVEMRGLEIHAAQEVDMMVKFVQKCPKLRQFNCLGMVMNPQLIVTAGLFDKLVTNVQAISGFDELQLGRKLVEENQTNKSAPPLITPSTLAHLLEVKPKWWRMALDGMALEDSHLHIIGSCLKDNKDCKMNDLLSLRDNPKITGNGLQALYKICLSKQRMGLVLSDDASWVATFDLVRPLNNLHRRLEYINVTGGGGYRSREAWINWLHVIGNLPWIGEARKLNYIWFTLLEQPEMITNTAASESTDVQV